MKQAKVISGFPGVGKSFLSTRPNLKISDSDSSKFSWVEKGVRHPDFPQNYIDHIRQCIETHDMVLVSSHKEVREALKANGIEYTIYYPSIESKDIYIERYRNRGNAEAFINLVDVNWDNWIKEIDKETFPTKVKMEGNTYLSNYVRK